MSKTIAIQESGLGKTLTVDALRIPKLGGGTLDVVPADGKNLVKITVKQNGTYKASDFGAYGIAEVRVACTLNGGSATSTATEKTISEALYPAPAEGGVPRNFTAKRIETPLSGGGSCQWLQKSDVSLGTKSINVDNTTYRAADDGYYGYSQVTVSGISITKTTDGNGNEVIEHTDGTGTETMIVPSSIVIDTPPSFTGPYFDGQTITFAGLVVKAYKGDGNLWMDENHPGGVIPMTELQFPIVKAEHNEYGVYRISEEGIDLSIYSDDIKRAMDEIHKPLIVGNRVSISGTNVSFEMTANGPIWVLYKNAKPGSTTDCIVFFLEGTQISAILTVNGYSADVTNNTTQHQSIWINKPDGTRFNSGLHSNIYYDGIGVPARRYFYDFSSYYGYDRPPYEDVENSECLYYVSQNHNIAKAAAILLEYGLKIPGNAIPVLWSRPGDNQVLETSFEITINGSSN